jgi:hypothetical protein
MCGCLSTQSHQAKISIETLIFPKRHTFSAFLKVLMGVHFCYVIEALAMMSVDSSSMVVTIFNDLDVAELLLSDESRPPLYIG